MFLRQLFERISRTGEGDTAVVGWGRGMGHKGHMMLASSVITKAKDVGGDPYFVVSRTVGKDDPITPDEKLAIYKKVFPSKGHIFQAASDELPDLTRVLTNLNQQGYKNAIVVVGADQVKAFQYLKQYNGKPDKSGNVAFNFDNLDVISRQETNDPSAGDEGPRATPMRQVLLDPSKSEEEQFAVWRDAMSPEISDDEVRDLMNKAKERMAQFSAPKKKGKGVAEGFFGIDDKIKGKIQNIVGRLSDEYGMWDHKAQTFTPDGLEHLKSILKFNDKYIKYALNLTSRDFEAEDVSEEQGYDEVSPKSASYILRKLEQGIPMSEILDDFPELSRMMEIIAGEHGLHLDDDFEQIEDILMNDLEDIAAEEDDFGDYDYDDEDENQREDAAGVGIITKQNTTKDVNKGTLRKMMKAYKLA